MELELTDFQVKLSKSILDGKDFSLYIAVKEDNVQWVIKLSDLKETSTARAISRLGIVKPWLLGVANFRGSIYSVIDFKQFFDKEATIINYKSIITIIDDRFNLKTGFLWSDIFGLFDERQLDRFPLNKGMSDDPELNDYLKNNQNIFDKRMKYISCVFKKKKDMSGIETLETEKVIHNHSFNEDGFWFLLDIDKMVDSGELSNIQFSKKV